jgi:hypothetical protein
MEVLYTRPTFLINPSYFEAISCVTLIFLFMETDFLELFYLIFLITPLVQVSPFRPDRLWSPPNLLSNGYRVLFPWS